MGSKMEVTPSRTSQKKVPIPINKEVEDDDEDIDEDPNFYRGTGFFRFPNGDTYNGDYIAHISGLIWREGNGIYRTKDGQIYSGEWYSDGLKESAEAQIFYPNGSKYIGHVKNNEYEGPAMYTIREGIHILCHFEENRPVRDICLFDTKGREWRAQAGELDALLLPEHVFYNDIPSRLGKGAPRIQTDKPSLDQFSFRTAGAAKKSTVLDHAALNKLEMKIFAKTKKIVSDLKLSQSDWYQNWIHFKKQHDSIVKKLGQNHLCQDERDWLSKYRDFKARYTAIMEARLEPKYKDLATYKMFELYNSGDYMHPTMIFASNIKGNVQKCDETKEEEINSLSRSFAWQ